VLQHWLSGKLCKCWLVVYINMCITNSTCPAYPALAVPHTESLSQQQLLCVLCLTSLVTENHPERNLTLQL
jgi:hypothetical protein